MNTKKIEIEKTKKGYPAYWEAGGGFSNTGKAIIIASPNGGPKKPVYVRRRGHLANGQHALFIIEKGDYIIKCDHHREDFEIQIFRVLNFEEEKEEIYAITEQVNRFSRGEWDKEPPAYLEQAVHTAMHKATCYHCRSPHFILE